MTYFPVKVMPKKPTDIKHVRQMEMLVAKHLTWRNDTNARVGKVKESRMITFALFTWRGKGSKPLEMKIQRRA